MTDSPTLTREIAAELAGCSEAIVSLAEAALAAKMTTRGKACLLARLVEVRQEVDRLAGWVRGPGESPAQAVPGGPGATISP
jgi:hypothetical protein